MKRVDFDRMCLDFLIADWPVMYGARDVAAAYSAFLETLNVVMDAHCPVKRSRFRRRECPWLTLSEELRDLQLRRDLARREWDRLRTESSRRRYTALRKRVRAALAEAWAEFFKTRSSPKDPWKTLRAYAFNSNTTEDPDGDLSAVTADRFNSYFAGVGYRIAEELAAQPVGHEPPRPPIVISAGFHVRPVTLPELGAALR